MLRTSKKALMRVPVHKIVAGGQSGAERGALDAALSLSLPYEGMCPKGRRAEDGPIAPRYNLLEAPNGDHEQRTSYNITRGDGVLICTFGRLVGPHRLTSELCEKLGKPWLYLDLNAEATDDAVARVSLWLKQHRVQTLTVAGGQECEGAGLHGAVKDLLLRVFQQPRTLTRF
jgi:hypothetical protein